MPSQRSFSGLHVFLTGASGGVGAAVLRHVATGGARVFATCKTQGKLDSVFSELPVEVRAELKGVAADLTRPFDLPEVVDEGLRWLDGRVDVLINVAGIGYHCPAANVRIDEVIEVMMVNAVAPIAITTHVLPGLRRSPAPKVINVSSFLGSKPLPLTATYTASKHALNGYSKVLRLEQAASRMSVTIIEPGAIDTAFINRTHDPEAVGRMAKRALQKLTADEVARWIIVVIESPAFSCPELIRIAPVEQAI